MKYNLDDPIVEVIEVVSEETANIYLKEGWILLETGFTHFKNTQEAAFLYSLGRPRSVRNKANDVKAMERNLKRIEGR
ncbi:hypothetical protein CD798_08310 [Bacillaceae bacterium SAOS 7]|nr:hypothetical protein CD798_08310 [Bacillaceae bacterium SAOS 7]